MKPLSPHPFRHALRALLLCSCLLPFASLAVPGGSTAKSVVRELTERLGRSGASDGAEALSTVGGKQLVEGLIEKASREGGEALVRRVHALGMRHGADAITVLSRNPKAYAEALEALPDAQVAPALWGALRQADVMDDMISQYGVRALRAEVAHPGIGASTLARLGDDAAPLLTTLPSQQLARLQPGLDSLANLPATERSKVITALRQAPGAVLDAMEKHPKILLTTGGVAAVVAVAHQGLQPSVTRKTLPDGTVIEEFTSFGDRALTTNRRTFAWLGAVVAGALGLRILLPAFRRKA